MNRISRRSFLGASAAAVAVSRLGRAAGPVFAATPMTADATPAARAAAAACRGAAGSVIQIPTGDYHFADPEAIRQMNAMFRSGIGGDIAWGPSRKPFQICFDFVDCEDLVLDGQGSTFFMNGLLAPISLRNCRRVTLKNFVIDWDRPLFTSGVVVKSGLWHADFEPGPGMEVHGNEPAWAWQACDAETGEFRALDAYGGLGLQKLPGGRARLWSQRAGELKPGDGLMVRHCGNFRPGVHILDSETVTLDNVTLRSNPGMGITGHRSRDLTLTGCRVERHPGRYLSLNADALHFISCRGEIKVEGGDFAYMADDGINCHNFYQVVKEKLDDRTLITTVLARVQDGYLDHPDPGDRLELCRRDTLVSYAETEVESVEASQEKWQVKIRLSKPLPADFNASDIFLNRDQLPRLTYRNNRVHHNRARAVLCQTRGVLIENNEFTRTTGTGIHVNTAGGTPGSWWESGGTRDVVIRGNRIIRCGFGPGGYLSASGVTVAAESRKEDPGVHRNLTIENNEIECPAGWSGIYLADVTNVRLSGNRITGTQNPVVVRPSVKDLRQD